MAYYIDKNDSVPKWESDIHHTHHKSKERSAHLFCSFPPCVLSLISSIFGMCVFFFSSFHLIYVSGMFVFCLITHFKATEAFLRQKR